MASLTDLKRAIHDLLGLHTTGQLLQLNADTRERAYEGYVLGLCGRAIRLAGGTVMPSGVVSGPNPQTLIFRGGPGQMWSRDQDFCYLACNLNRKTFELHLDVTFEGHSGANHEVDISLVDAGHAAEVRRRRIIPRTNKNLVGAIECKFYEAAPGVVLARTFVGLLRDCSTQRVRAFAANRSSPGLNMYLSQKWAPAPFVDLDPGNQTAEQRFVGYVAQQLRQWSHS